MTRKLFKEKMLKGFSAMAVAFILIGSYNMVTYASESLVVANNEDEGIMPHADIIEYRYKVVGTKVYRRLYNYSKECWVGDWEFVTEGYIED